MFNWRRFILIQVIIILLAISPLLSVFAASRIATYFGCELHEGFVNPCIAFGQDIGASLYSGFVSGWYMFISLPLGFLAWCIHIGYGIFKIVKDRRTSKKPS